MLSSLMAQRLLLGNDLEYTLNSLKYLGERNGQKLLNIKILQHTEHSVCLGRSVQVWLFSGKYRPRLAPHREAAPPLSAGSVRPPGSRSLR